MDWRQAAALPGQAIPDQWSLRGQGKSVISQTLELHILKTKLKELSI